MKLMPKQLFIIISLTVFLVACNDASTPKEGEQYEKLITPLKSNLLSPVTEVFSLTCSHCRKLEKYLPQISRESGSEISKMHITFNRAADNKALLYYAAEIQLDKTPSHSFIEQLFAAIRHSKIKQRKQAIERVFTSHDLINPYKFTDQQNKQLISKVNRVRKLSEQSNIHAVPTFIINGRYQVLLKGHKDQEEIAKTIKYLLSLNPGEK